MIPLIITAALIPAAVYAAVALEPHMESWATRKRLIEAHRAFGGTSNTDNPGIEPQATSPNRRSVKEPHQPRVPTSNSPVSHERIES